MSFWRRIFTAPGNPRVWLSLMLYGTALVAILVYRDRIGHKAAEAFRELTTAPPMPAQPPPTPAETATAKVARAAKLAPGERERTLFLEARSGSEVAAKALHTLLTRDEPVVVPAPLVAMARASLDEGPRSTRALAAGLLLAAENVRREVAGTRAQVAALKDKSKRDRRLVAITRVGLLGLLDVRSKTAERQLLYLLGASTQKEVRAESARALGRIGDPAFQPVLMKLVTDRSPALLREAALAGLVDLGLAGSKRRSRVLRGLAAVLADKNVTGERAEEAWRSLRRLAAQGRSEALLPGAPSEAAVEAVLPEDADSVPPAGSDEN